MILSDIKHYLQVRGQATLEDLALHFNVDPDAMRGMLGSWIEKGRVVRSGTPAGCRKGCGSCGCAATVEIYTWRC